MAPPSFGNYKDGGNHLPEDKPNEVHQDQEAEDTSNQVVVYEPEADESPNPPRSLPAVGFFAAQCETCRKWRLIPSEQKYEEIRDQIMDRPFYCEVAREWRPDISCDVPTDISQEEGQLWALDKPIAKPPPGWKRQLRFRGEGSTKFADVYYVAPCGTRLRSMVEVQLFLHEYPDYKRNGVRASQFSFRIPTPSRSNYVRKRSPRVVPPRAAPEPVPPPGCVYAAAPLRTIREPEATAEPAEPEPTEPEPMEPEPTEPEPTEPEPAEPEPAEPEPNRSQRLRLTWEPTADGGNGFKSWLGVV